MEEQNNENKGKKPSKKVSTIFLIIGIMIVIAGIIGIVLDTSSGRSAIVPICGVGIIIGLAFLTTGLMPYMAKLNAKLSKESMDYAGKDLTTVGKKGAKIIRPGVEEVTKGIASSVHKAHEKTTCPYCGEEVDKDQAYCDECGKPLKKVCASCGKANDSDNKFCKYCGKRL